MRQGLAGHIEGRLMLEPLEARLLLDGVAGQQPIEVFGISPALFVENQGQWADESVRYAFQGDGANVAFTDAGLVFQVFRAEAAEDADAPGAWDDPFAWPEEPFAGDGVVMRGAEFSVSFDGANAATPAGLDQSQSVFNYYVGDQADWRSGVPAYETISYPNLYDGIDLYTWGRRDSLKYEFHVAPGADYRAIQVSYDGIEGLWIDAAGALHMETELGELIDDAPYIYQDIDAQRVDVAGGFELIDADTYAFEITGDYDRTAELIIDPYMMWSTYLGGVYSDVGKGIAADSLDNILVGGNTHSSGWVSGGFDTSHNPGCDTFVVKISPSGQHIWSTYLGGSAEDYADGVAVDSSGNVLVAGYTVSSGWVSGGFDTTYNGAGDAFAAKLSPTGQHIWSTYVGGTDTDRGRGIAVDSLGNVLVGGRTQSAGWVSGGFDTTYNGGAYDGFVAQLSGSGQHIWSTYLGGDATDRGYGIAVDSGDNVLVAGYTQSYGWVSGGFDTTHNGPGGGADAFVAKLSPSGGHVWSTYLGGGLDDWADAIAVDSVGNVLVGGWTRSSGWVSGGFDTSYNGIQDAFVAKISPSGQHTWSTYLGGGDQDQGDSIAVDSLGNVLVAGDTRSPGWISGGFDTSHNGGVWDAFAAKLSPSGEHIWSTYLGGAEWDGGRGIAADSLGTVLVTGDTQSSGCVWGGFDTTHGNAQGDGFVVKIGEGSPVLGDANGDGVVDWTDCTIWADNYLLHPVPAWLAGGWMFANFNADDIVDGADYTIWADNCTPPPTPGDANGDGAVDGADYTIWADHYHDQPVPPWLEGGWTFGNFTAGYTVDGADYTIWADNFTGVGGGSAGALPAADANGDKDILLRAAAGWGLSLVARGEDDPHMATHSAPACRQAGGHATRRNLPTIPGPSATIPRAGLHALPGLSNAAAEASRQYAHPRAAWGGGSARTPGAEGQAALDDEIDLLAGPDLSVLAWSM